MEPKSVALIDLGENLSISLDDLAFKLNSIQGEFDFVPAGTITLEAVGEPDVEEIWYSTRLLYGVLGSRVRTPEFDFIIGITHLPVAQTDDEGKTIDKNYFSLSDQRQLSVLSTHANVMVFKPPWKTELQYIGYLAMGELLINLTGHDLMHLMANNCLFDDCADRTRLAQCIDRSHICDQCRLSLKKEHSVSDQLIGDVESVLRWCRRTTARMALAYALGHPITALFVGIGLGWFAQIFVTGGHYVAMLLITLALPAFLFMRKWLSK